jgi:hypothetical protein
MEKSNYIWKILITIQDMIFYLFENNTLQWLQKRINQLAILTTVNFKKKSLEKYSIKILLLLISPYRCHNIVNLNWTFQHGNILPPSYYECHTRFFSHKLRKIYKWKKENNNFIKHENEPNFWVQSVLCPNFC